VLHKQLVAQSIVAAAVGVADAGHSETGPRLPQLPLLFLPYDALEICQTLFCDDVACLLPPPCA